LRNICHPISYKSHKGTVLAGRDHKIRGKVFTRPSLENCERLEKE
jgi:hypothetical protein